MQKLRDAALAYAKAGLPVIPITPLDKTPLIAEWEKAATTYPAQVEAWWTQWPDANIATCPGMTGRFVIDIDPAKGGSWEHTETFTVETASGGKHLWYKGTGPSTNGTAKKGLGIGIDTRGGIRNGDEIKSAGYVLMPPSRVKYTGKAAADHNVEEGFIGEYRQGLQCPPLRIPDWVAGKLGAPSSRKAINKTVQLDLPEEIAKAQFDIVYEVLTNGVPEIGEGSDIRGWELGCKIIDRGISAEKCLDLLAELWAPHFDRKWLKEKADSAWRNRENDVGCNAGAQAKFGNAYAAYRAAQPKNPAGVPDGIKDCLNIGPDDMKIEWVWQDYLPRGMITLLAGTTGDGKTSIAVSLAAIITSGGKFPDGTQAEVGSCLLWCGEDDFKRTIFPRFLAMGGDRRKLYYVDMMPHPEGGIRSFTPAHDMPTLAEAAAKIPDLALVMLDPIVRATGNKRDSNNNADVREGLDPVKIFAEQSNAAVIGITHFTKGSENKPILDRFTGSLAWLAVARVAFATAKLQDGSHRFVRAKSNVGPSDDGFEYDLPVKDGMSSVAWGEALKGDADTLVNGAERQTKVAEACKLIRRELRDGKQPVKAIMEALTAEGVTKATRDRARDLMRKNGLLIVQREAECWYWRLRTAEEQYSGPQLGA